MRECGVGNGNVPFSQSVPQSYDERYTKREKSMKEGVEAAWVVAVVIYHVPCALGFFPSTMSCRRTGHKYVNLGEK